MRTQRYRKTRERQGIDAVIFLQAYAGIIETVITAVVRWRELDDHQQARVLDAYTQMRGQTSDGK